MNNTLLVLNKASSPARRDSPLSWLRLGRWRWRLASEALDKHLEPALSQPETLLQPPAIPVARVPPRTSGVLVRLERPATDEPALFVRRYRPGSLWERLKDCFRPSRALRAFELAEQLREMEIPTAHALAVGEMRRWGWLLDSYLITEEVTDVCNWEQLNPDRPTSTALLRALARTLARMHDARLTHGDPARPNFLVRVDSSGAVELILIDLEGLRRHSFLSERKERKSLAHALWRIAPGTRDRLWFLAEYCRQRGRQESPRALERKMISLLWQTIAQGKGSREYGVQEMGGLQWYIRRPLITPAVEAILRAPDAFLAKGRVLKPSRSSAVTAGNGLVLKRDNYRKRMSRIKDAWRGSRGVRSFQKASLLDLAGIPTARAIAAADVRCWGLVQCSYLLMEEIPGAVPLDQFPGPRIEGVIQVADLLAKLHQNGFSHRDLKAGNLVFDLRWRPHLIDLDGLRYRGDTPDRAAAADLARLFVNCIRWPKPLSRTDCLRFLIRYCRRRKRADWRLWWRWIEESLSVRT